LLSDLSGGEELAEISKARELDPLSPVINFQVGRALERLGRFDDALAQYKMVIENNPAYPSAYWGIGEIYRSVLGRFDEAAASFRKATALDPGNSSGPAVLGWVYLELGDVHNAEAWINKSIEEGPEIIWPNVTMEYLHLYRGEEAQALDYARKVLTIWPTEWFELAHLSNHDLEAGRYAEARAWYENSYPALLNDDEPTIDTTNYRAAIDLAYVLSKTGEQKRADLLLDRSLMLIQTIHRLGFYDGYWISDVRIYALQGKTEKALAALRQAIDERWRVHSWYYLEHDPVLDSIRDEPEFQRMAEEIKADMAAQLERVRALEASGELEPIPDI
jgi:tetratricopeptide (TPR) repeat protein